MISPFKAVIGDAYKGVEARLLAAIHLRFGLPVKRADDLERLHQDRRPRAPPISKRRGSPASSAAEARRFFGPPPKLSPALERDYLTPWPAETAEERYAASGSSALVARVSFRPHRTPIYISAAILEGSS